MPARRPQDRMTISMDSPQEDECALCSLGAASPYEHIAFPGRWTSSAMTPELERLSEEEQSRWEERFVRFLKKVILARPGRIVVKSPTHTFRIKTLLRLFPKARFVHIVADECSDLGTARSAVDYIIITHEDFYEGIQALKAFREAQGLTVEVAGIQDIYDEFSCGIKDAAAIRDFLAYAYGNWHQSDHPAYVLLGADDEAQFEDISDSLAKPCGPGRHRGSGTILILFWGRSNPGSCRQCSNKRRCVVHPRSDRCFTQAEAPSACL